MPTTSWRARKRPIPDPPTLVVTWAKEALANRLGKTGASIDDADYGLPVFDRDVDLYRFSFRRHLGRVLDQIGEGGADRARDHANPQIVLPALDPNLCSLLYRFKRNRPNQYPEIGHLGLGHLFGAEGEKRP